MSSNYTLADNPLSLDNIRSVLIRLEETIIFSLIERAQFAHNPIIYTPGGFPELEKAGCNGSWLEWFLRETESFHARARRYSSPDEYPFSSDLPPPVVAPTIKLPQILWPNDINVNPKILGFYRDAIVPRITRQASRKLAERKSVNGNGKGSSRTPDDDGNYGSAATIDVEVLQAISKRVHYGKFVSEAKFIQDPAAFVPHILNPNPEALDALITKPAVEKALLERLERKARTYGRDLGPTGEPLESGAMKIDVEAIRDLYESYIIPLTKEVEVNYLLQRLNGLSREEIEALSKPKGHGRPG